MATDPPPEVPPPPRDAEVPKPGPTIPPRMPTPPGPEPAPPPKPGEPDPSKSTSNVTPLHRRIQFSISRGDRVLPGSLCSKVIFWPFPARSNGNEHAHRLCICNRRSPESPSHIARNGTHPLSWGEQALCQQRPFCNPPKVKTHDSRCKSYSALLRRSGVHPDRRAPSCKVHSVVVIS